MKRKLTKATLSELELHCEIMKLFEQKGVVGGGDGSINNPYTYEQFCAASCFPGGWVKMQNGEVTYCFPEIVVTPDDSNSSGTNYGTGFDGNTSYGNDNGSSSQYDSSSTGGNSSSGSCYGSPSSGLQILENARQYEGTKYVSGGISSSGIDCSGLIMRACNLNFRWTTSDMLPPGKFEVIKPNTSSNESFISFLDTGDILVWPGRHAVIYVGGNNIYHSHTTGVNQTGDLSSYWLSTNGFPTVYRIK